MAAVNARPPSPQDRPVLVKPVVLGTACCVASAICYTAANICLRQLAALEADEMWVTCMKEVVTVATVGPWLVVQGFRRRTVLPPPGALAKLLLVALGVQLLGNLSLQWAFGVVGLAIAVPAVFGLMLTSSAVMGWLLLGERVSGRSIAAIGLLVVSIALLSLGAGEVRRAVEQVTAAAEDPMRTLAGVGAACLAGIMFASLTIAIRSLATARVPVASIVFVVTGMGVVSLGGLSLARLGWRELAATPPEHLGWMLAAGACNLVAFLAITKGLQLTTVVHANVLNASQVALGALAGILLFTEPPNPWLVIGVVLTIGGMMLIQGPAEEEVAGA